MARYDLNVWDYSGYPGYDDKPRWRIDVYECEENWQHFDTPEKVIFLTDTQAEMLTLGKSPDEGGDYDWDTDFWIDPRGFLEVYKSVPRKVLRYLEQLDLTY